MMSSGEGSGDKKRDINLLVYILWCCVNSFDGNVSVHWNSL